MKRHPLLRPDRATRARLSARADGALPPVPRWLKDDPYAAARMAAGLSWAERQMLDDRRQRAVDQLDALDAEAIDWMRRKRVADREALDLHEHLWPAVPSGWARRPPRPDEAPLPPEMATARPLYRAPLRRVCLALLRIHGELTLRELHCLLLLYGFTIGGDGPVKRLAEASAIYLTA